MLRAGTVVLGLFCCGSCFAVLSLAHADEAEDLLREAAGHWMEKDTEQALASIAASLQARTTPDAYRLRAFIYGKTGQHAEAVADLNELIKLTPKSADAYSHRGSEHFMAGQFKESVADFDQQIKLAPETGPGHWERGISCYYAGQFAEGAKQFAAYHTKVDDNDVENSIWRCMCMTRESSLEKARADMLVVKHDGRVGMMEAYQMFAGKAEPAAVLKAAETDASPEQLNQQRFYANLYIGLFYDITGNVKLARSHLNEAEKHRIDHYMWEVARVHAKLLNEQPQGTSGK